MLHLDDYIVKQENATRSRKLYRMTCDDCGLDRGYQRKKKYGHGKCRVCVAKFLHTDKEVSSETKQKMKENNWSKRGHQHPLLGTHLSDETKAKLSEATAKQNKTRKTKFLYVGPMGSIYMKSSWEIKYAKYLDSIGETWKYEPSFKLSNNTTYLPDFQLSCGDIVEVKGYMRDDAQAKWDLFCSDYPLITKSLVKKDNLKTLRII